MKKRRRRKFSSFIFKIIVLGLIVYLGIYLFSFFTSSKEERALQKLNYTDKAIPLIIKEELDEYLIEKNVYSKTLEVALIEDKYDHALLEYYINLSYKDYDDYIDHINKLYSIGYKTDDMKIIFDKLDETDIDTIIEIDNKIDNISSYLNNEYFVIDNLDRYVNYKKKHTTYNNDKVILYVNMYLDYPFYEYTIDVKNSDDPLVLANKYYKLSSSFTPKELVTVDKVDSYNGYTFQVTKTVKEKFGEMLDDMNKEDLDLLVKSAYRSYQTQVTLYNDYIKQSGKTQADTFSARAGHSEHQTGLAIDVCAAAKCDYGLFENTKEYQWMIKNAHKYGFILRFPEDKTNITGYKFESWHYRYVGESIAKYIYEHDLTLDEYYAMFIAFKKD